MPPNQPDETLTVVEPTIEELKRFVVHLWLVNTDRPRCATCRLIESHLSRWEQQRKERSNNET